MANELPFENWEIPVPPTRYPSEAERHPSWLAFKDRLLAGESRSASASDSSDQLQWETITVVPHPEPHPGAEALGYTCWSALSRYLLEGENHSRETPLTNARNRGDQPPITNNSLVYYPAEEALPHAVPPTAWGNAAERWLQQQQTTKADGQSTNYELAHLPSEGDLDLFHMLAYELHSASSNLLAIGEALQTFPLSSGYIYLEGPGASMINIVKTVTEHGRENQTTVEVFGKEDNMSDRNPPLYFSTIGDRHMTIGGRTPGATGYALGFNRQNGEWVATHPVSGMPYTTLDERAYIAQTASRALSGEYLRVIKAEGAVLRETIADIVASAVAIMPHTRRPNKRILYTSATGTAYAIQWNGSSENSDADGFTIKSDTGLSRERVPVQVDVRLAGSNNGANEETLRIGMAASDGLTRAILVSLRRSEKGELTITRITPEPAYAIMPSAEQLAPVRSLLKEGVAKVHEPTFLSRILDLMGPSSYKNRTPGVQFVTHFGIASANISA